MRRAWDQRTTARDPSTRPFLGASGRVRLRRRRRRQLVAMAVVVALVSVPVGDLGLYLARPSSDPVSVRAVEWMRERGGSPVVNRAERWWYTTHPPPVGGAPPRPLPAATTVTAVLEPDGGPSIAATLTEIAVSQPVTQPRQPAQLPPSVRLQADPPLPGEGQWAVVVGSTERPLIATTVLRPDPVHTSLLAGVARVDQRYARFTLLPGAEQPERRADAGAVPATDVPALVGIFNAGFLQRESRGGWFAGGREVAALREGAASFVIHADGTATVARWGRDAAIGPDVIAVRQNLSLLVDDGAPVPEVHSDNVRLWGSTLGNRVEVWRSGVGVTADGAIVYVGGPGLTVSTLANLLTAAGAVRAMELDINSAWVAMFTFQQTAGAPVGTKLLPDMHRTPDRYLTGQSRDFFAVLAR
jgi:hypothetical protein